MFELIGNGHLLGRMFLGLPAGGNQQANICQRRARFLRRHRRVQHIDKMPNDILFFAQHRATRRFSRVSCEHGLDLQRIE